jgi:hypothetical protein
MNDTEAKAIANGSSHNRRYMTPGTACGCFYCLQVFPADEVVEWIDDGRTPLCPRCGIESVVPGVTDGATLQALHSRGFGRSHQLSAAERDAMSARPRRASGR